VQDAVSVWKSAPTTGDRAMIRTSQPGWNEGAITLSASRSRLRTRFRTTAPPSLRPVDSRSASPRDRPSDSKQQQRMGPDGSLSLQRREVLRLGEHHQPRRIVAAVRIQTVSFLRP